MTVYNCAVKRLLIITLLLSSLLFAACGMTESDEVDGGVIIENSIDAPKVIESTEITEFYCECSTLAMATDLPLSGYVFTLEAAVNGDVVTGTFSTRGREAEDFSFETDIGFMEALQDIVAEYDLPQHNGHSYRVSGLPDQYGAVLSVKYASEESIYASDNQDNFLSMEAVEALIDLFRVYAPEEPLLPICISTCMELEHTDFTAVYVEYPVLESDALASFITAYNEDIRIRQTNTIEVLHSAAKLSAEYGKTYGELFSVSEAHLTRNDASALSFYETTETFEGFMGSSYDFRCFNLDPETGGTLFPEDVFTDPQSLAPIITEALAVKYGEIPDFTLEMLREHLTNETGLVDFALGYHGVTFLIAAGLLDGDPHFREVTVSFADYPELVKEEFRTAPAAFMLPLSYGSTLYLRDGLSLSLDWEPADQEQGLWTGLANGIPTSELFYGYAPVCHVLQTEAGAYLYLTVPTGDVSMMTRIFAVTAEGLNEITSVDMAVAADSPMDPNDFLMLRISEETGLPEAEHYRVDDTGYPVPIE